MAAKKKRARRAIRTTRLNVGAQENEAASRPKDSVADELLLIRELDTEILRLKYERLFPLIQTTLKSFPRICAVRGIMSFYVRCDNEFVLTTPKKAKSIPQRITLPPKILHELKTRKTALNLVGGHPGAESVGTDLNASGYLLFPLCYPRGHLLGIFCFSFKASGKPSFENDLKRAFGSFGRICAQLQIAFRTLYDQRLRLLTEQLWEFVLDEHIDAESGFDFLAARSREFLPDFYPLRISERPYVNVLAYSTHENQLVIRGATEAASRNAPVDIDRSITGKLIRDNNSDIININPRDETQYQNLYLRYYTDTTIPIREVAIKLFGRGDIKGVLNFEFFRTPIFSKSHEAFLAAAQKSLSLLFSALEARWQVELQSARGQEATTHAYINTFAKALRHEIFAYTSAISTHINAATYSDDINLVKATLQDINDNDAKIVTAINQFTMDAAAIAQRSNVDLKSLFLKMRKFYIAGKKEELVRAPFDIKIRIPDHSTARMSRLVEIFINALFENSFNSFARKRDRQSDFVGEIDVSCSGKEINTGHYKIEYDVITVKDNGLGVSGDRLKQLQDGRYLSDHGGLGWALSGFDRYMRELGGSLEVDSDEGESFVVRLVFKRRQPNPEMALQQR